MSSLYNAQDLDIDLGAAGIAAVAALGPLHLATLDLVGINGPWGRNADYVALKAAITTFTGYAQGVITWDAPSLDDLGNIELIGTIPAFRCTVAGPSQVAFGVLVQNGAGTKMYLNGALDGPVDFSGPLDQLIVTLRWKPATQTLAVSIG